MRKIGLAAVVFLASAVGSAAAQTQAEGQKAEGQKAESQTQTQPSARYAFNPANDGFLRLDNVSGQVSFCGPTSAGWACQVVPEDRAALEKEIARLEQRQKELTAELENPETYRQPGRAVAVNRELTHVTEDLARAIADWEQAAARLAELKAGS